MTGLLVTGAFVLSAMTIGLAAADVLFTDVWPADADEPWYVFALRAVVGTVVFVAIGGVPAAVAAAASPVELAVFTTALLPVTAASVRYVLRA